MIKLGDKAKCKVTGFTGIVVAITEWLYSCRRITLQPPVDKEGKHKDSATFDEPSVVLVKAQFVESTPKQRLTGGMQDDKAALLP